MHAPKPRSQSRFAFTLVELLVVIGIIALLISILLPSLNKARRAASTIKCSSNLRSIMQAMNIYASSNKGWYPGSANTSGLHYMTNGSFSVPPGQFTENNAPFINTMNDWQSPLAQVLGIRFDGGATDASRLSRYLQFNSSGIFACPENQDVLTTKFGSSTDWGAVPLVSYNMAFAFTLVNSASPRAVGISSASSANNRTHGNVSGGLPAYDPPAGYGMKQGKIKNSTQKIAFAEGARSYQGSVAPTYDNTLSGGGGNIYADQGSWSTFTRAFFRNQAAGNGGTGTDARMYWARHGNRSPKSKGGNFRMNVAFWDGHAETMDDLESSNPNLWLPTGTQFQAGRGTQQPNDTYDKFMAGQTGTVSAQ